MGVIRGGSDRRVSLQVRRWRNARGHVGRAERCSSGNRERQQRSSEGRKDGKAWRRRRQEHEREVTGHGQAKWPTRCVIRNQSGHTGRNCPSRVQGTVRSDSSHSPGFSRFAWAGMVIEVPLSFGLTAQKSIRRISGVLGIILEIRIRNLSS